MSAPAAASASGAAASSLSPSVLLNAKQSSELSHTLSKILRHAAPSLGLRLDSSGYASMDALLALPMMRRMPFAHLHSIQTVVASCPKQRFHLLKPSEGGGEWRIRANQGHNKQLAEQLDEAALMTPITLESPNPKLCLHGTTAAAWAIIQSTGGLHPMQRTHIHFASEDFGSAQMISGMRVSSQVLIHIDVHAALRWAQSHTPKMHLTVFQSANGVILTQGVVELTGMLPSFLFSRVESVGRAPHGGGMVRTDMQWDRPTEAEWMDKFGQQRANPSAAAVQAASNKSAAASSSSTPSRTNSNGAASSSSAAAASSSPAAIRPAAPVRESKWGPPASSRPPPGWAVPDNLQHIVDGTSASSNGVANGVKAASSAALQPFQYLLVLDFEATCDERKDDEPRFEGQEIIEFPMVLVNTQTGEVEAEFHQYVTPVIHKQLTPFCTELTGITQKMVSPESGAKPFAEVWRMVIAFLEKHHLIPSTDASSSSSSSEVVHPFAIVTCGDWDLKTMLLLQFSHTFGSHSSSSEVPRCFRSWINIKHAYNNHYKPKTQARGMTDLLSQLRLPLEGRHHSGIDDSRNITSVAKRMLQDGWIARYTKQEKMGPRAGGQQQQNGHGVTPAANGAASASSGARQPSALQAALRKNQGSSKTPSAQ